MGAAPMKSLRCSSARQVRRMSCGCDVECSGDVGRFNFVLEKRMRPARQRTAFLMLGRLWLQKTMRSDDCPATAIQVDAHPGQRTGKTSKNPVFPQRNAITAYSFACLI